MIIVTMNKMYQGTPFVDLAQFFLSITLLQDKMGYDTEYHRKKTCMYMQPKYVTHDLQKCKYLSSQLTGKDLV